MELNHLSRDGHTTVWPSAVSLYIEFYCINLIRLKSRYWAIKVSIHCLLILFCRVLSCLHCQLFEPPYPFPFHPHLHNYSYRCYFLMHHKCPSSCNSCCAIKDSIYTAAHIFHLVIVWMDELAAGHQNSLSINPVSFWYFPVTVIKQDWLEQAKQTSQRITMNAIYLLPVISAPKEEQTNIRLSNATFYFFFIFTFLTL